MRRALALVVAFILAFSSVAGDSAAQGRAVARVVLLIAERRAAASTFSFTTRVACAELEGANVFLTRFGLSRQEIEAAKRLGAELSVSNGATTVRESVPLRTFEELVRTNRLAAKIGVPTMAADEALVRKLDEWMPHLAPSSKTRAALIPKLAGPGAAERLNIGSGVKMLIASHPSDIQALRAVSKGRPVVLQMHPDLAGLDDFGRSYRVDILHDLPKDQRGLERVHGISSSPEKVEAQLRYLAAIDTEVTRLPNWRRLSSGARSSAAQIRTDYATAQRDQLLVLIAHNDNGVLRFADGSSLPISDLMAVRSRGKLAIVTCNGVRYTESTQPMLLTSTRTLKYSEGIAAAKRLKARIGEQRASLEDALSEAEDVAGQGPLAPLLVGIAGSILLLQPLVKSHE